VGDTLEYGKAPTRSVQQRRGGGGGGAAQTSKVRRRHDEGRTRNEGAAVVLKALRRLEVCDTAVQYSSEHGSPADSTAAPERVEKRWRGRGSGGEGEAAAG